MQSTRPEVAMRRWWLYLVLAFLVATFGVRANNGIEVRGNLSANDTEREEGYFAVAQDTVLMVRPGSPAHQWLKANSGRIVRVVIEPAETR
jgi:hypothetical protein